MIDCSKTENFFKEWDRMCKSCDINYDFCMKCILYNAVSVKNDIDSAIKMVQNWSDDHPYMTRQSKFLESFPNAIITEDGFLELCPYDIDSTFKCDGGTTCNSCRASYWLEGVE